MDQLAGERHTRPMEMVGRSRNFPRQRPVLGDSTEELGGIKAEEGEEGLPDCSEGEDARDLSIEDTTRDPRLAVEGGGARTLEFL